MKLAMLRHGLLFLTIGFCAVAAGAAVRLELIWYEYIRHISDLAANLPAVLIRDLAPLAVYAASALACRRRWELLLVTCICAGLAAGPWVVAAISPPEVRDPDLDMGLRGFCIAIPHCVLSLILVFLILAMKPWRIAET